MCGASELVGLNASDSSATDPELYPGTSGVSALIYLLYFQWNRRGVHGAGLPKLRFRFVKRSLCRNMEEALELLVDRFLQV